MLDTNPTQPLIYLDHAATTPLDPTVLDAMLPYLSNITGNPSSLHRAGRTAQQALDRARDTIAQVLHCRPTEIIFTSGGSEADNLALKGVAFARQRQGRHIITSTIEHHAILHTADYLESCGFAITRLPVDTQGLINPADLRAALRPDTVLVSLMYANNEIGTIQPIAELGQICREHGVPLHTDAVQAAGSLPLDVEQLQVDLLTLAAHKLYGPRGTGLLYVRRGTPLQPQIHGGGQERQRRAGTESVAALVGMATALQQAEERRAWYGEHCQTLRDHLIDTVLNQIAGASLNGHRSRRLPNNANLSFRDIEAESLLLLLDQHGICASSGSACSSGAIEPSHVLLALGLPHEQAQSALRLSVGRHTTIEQVDYFLDVLPKLIAQLRSYSA
ncbi:MAG: cysteine desulfurase [Chloroflexaceae bacterium]|nr:cysteine desulfurase [Chloroflexaceae bacterium]